MHTHTHTHTHLHGCDGALGCGCDALLQATQVGGERGLVADSRGDAAQQRRHLRVGLVRGWRQFGWWLKGFVM
jgi:hypothetical protein